MALISAVTSEIFFFKYILLQLGASSLSLRKFPS